MPDGWNAEIYRRRAAQWRQEAQSRPEGKERDACINWRKATSILSRRSIVAGFFSTISRRREGTLSNN